MEFTPILWTYHKAKDGLCPIKIRISKDGKETYIPEGRGIARVSVSDWSEAKCRVKDSHPNYIFINKLIVKTMSDAEREYLQAQLEDREVSAGQIADVLESNGDFYHFFQKLMIEPARERDSHRWARNLESMLRMFKLWRPAWPIKELNLASLQSLERFLREKRKNGTNGVAIKMGAVRTAISNMGELVAKNPFDSYTIKTEPTEEKVVPVADIRKLRAAAIPPLHRQAIRARDFWLACYSGGGLRWGDLCRLQRKHLAGGRIRLTPHKTMRTSGAVVDHVQSEEFKSIVKRYLPEGKNPDDYVFPILNGRYKTEKAIDQRINDVGRGCNQSLKYLTKRFKLSVRPTMNMARHTLLDGVDDIFVSMQLAGHSSVRTTQKYKRTKKTVKNDRELLKALK